MPSVYVGGAYTRRSSRIERSRALRDRDDVQGVRLRRPSVNNPDTKPAQAAKTDQELAVQANP